MAWPSPRFDPVTTMILLGSISKGRLEVRNSDDNECDLPGPSSMIPERIPEVVHIHVKDYKRIEAVGLSMLHKC